MSGPLTDKLIKADPALARKVWLYRNPGIVSALSEQLNVSPSLVYKVLSGQRRSSKVSAALAAAGAPGFKEKRNAQPKSARKKRPA